MNALRFSIFGFAFLLGCATPGERDAIDGAACRALSKPAPQASSPRPFYIVGHNPNTPERAVAFLQAGANALEPDLRLDGSEIRVRDVIFGGRVRWPPGGDAGPTLSEYLRGLREKLAATKTPAPALIAWDLKPPFEIGWMNTALQTIRAELGRYYPDTAMLYTAGGKDGIAPLKELAALLVAGEAIGIDDHITPERLDAEFRNLRVPYTFSDGTDADSIAAAIALRDRGGSYRLVYAWTVNRRATMHELLLAGVDAMIVDDVPGLCATLALPQHRASYRLAAPQDHPFGSPVKR
jgi:hypothetical protein